jgi:hypothetical protein
MVAVAFLLVQGCELLLGPAVCPGAINAAITVRVLDSSTGQALGVAPVGVLTDGAYVETMVFDEGYLAGGVGRPGTYDAEVIAPGYALWRADGIIAKPAECTKVDGIELTAHLVPVHAVTEATSDGARGVASYAPVDQMEAHLSMTFGWGS